MKAAQKDGRLPVETGGDRDEEHLAKRIRTASSDMKDEQKAELAQLRSKTSVKAAESGPAVAPTAATASTPSAEAALGAVEVAFGERACGTGT